MLAEEHMWLLAFSAKSHLIGVFEVSHGTADSCQISPREVFVRLCLAGGVCFLLVHNHPSGDAAPSTCDMEVTERMVQAGKLMDIQLLDHIVIGRYEYYSFLDHGLIEKI